MPDDAPQSDDRETAGDRERRRMWALSGMGFELASEIAAGALLGFGADYLFGSRPVGIIVGTVLGIVVAMGRFLRQALDLVPATKTGAVPHRETREAEATPPEERDP